MSGVAATSTTNHPNTTLHRSQPANQACAACKYQRRKCNTDCILAPYFPAERQRQFLNAHRLFGVRNILRIIRGLDPFQQVDAMRSIISESNARAHDPVGGCYHIILQLRYCCESLSLELADILRCIAFYRSQAQAQQPHNLMPDVEVVDDHNPDPDYNYFCYDEADDNNNSSNSNSINDYNNIINNSNEQSMLTLQQHSVVFAEDDAKALAEVSDENVDPQLEFTEGNHPNRMETKEDAILMEHDLKGAASLFTLTNYHVNSVM